MHYDQYEIKRGEKALTYEFVSQGPKGDVPKLIVYSETNILGTFNLGFGDKIRGDDFDDKVVTNNGDALKVMATVAETIYSFTDRFPNARVFVEGSTKTRTRLYRMAIANNLEMISVDFRVYGLRNHTWEAFTVGMDYEAFVVIRKQIGEK